MHSYEPIPRYYKIKEDLQKQIDSGEYEVNQPIPSENELIVKYGVSRTTVRKAIDVLTKEGYLYTIQGKGTYVKSKFTQGLVKLTSCTEDIRSKGFNPSVKVLACEITNPSEKIRNKLNLDEYESAFKLQRIMFADDMPINKTTSYTKASLFKGIENYNFEVESLYRVIEMEFNIQIDYATRTIEAKLCDLQTAEQLQIQEGDPMLYFEGLVFANVGQVEMPIEYFESLYRSDKWKFFIEQVR